MAVNHGDPRENEFLREWGPADRDRFISGFLPDDRVTAKHPIKLFIRVPPYDKWSLLFY